MREHYLHICSEQSFAIHAYDMSAVGIDVMSTHKLFPYRVMSTGRIDVVSGHMKYCRIDVVSQDCRMQLQNTNEGMTSDFMAF